LSQVVDRIATNFLVAAPASANAGTAVSVTVTARDASNATVTTYAGTVQFTTGDPAAVLPANYTFVAGDNGAHTFQVTFNTPGSQSITATDTISASINGTASVNVAGTALPAPQNLIAMATSTTGASVQWTAVTGASSYEIWRSTSVAGPFTPAGTSATTSFSESGLTANTTYLYKVRAVGGAFSAVDAATTVVFTDAVPVTIKAVHVTQLRTAINAMRAAGGLPPSSFTDAALAGMNVKAAHLNELRTALDQARAALTLPALTYADTIVAGVAIKASHLTEIRAGTQ